jgi:hypothetical protein
MRKSLCLLAGLALAPGAMSAADPPEAAISNGKIQVRIYLPDAQTGFYRGTRFDWAGVACSLKFAGHEYYGPWFNKTRPDIHDFNFEGPDIVAGPASGITGPVDEFRPVGFEDAKPGDAFIKIGVGALRKPDERRYDGYRIYEIADGGKRTVAKKRESVTFTQEVAPTASGYGYSYRKTLRLEKGKPVMVLEHSLKNTGSRPIKTSVYNHNFLVLDGRPTDEGYTLTVPFQIASRRPPNPKLAEIRGNKIVYLKALEGRDVVTTPLEGFPANPAGSEVRIENSKAGAGMSIVSDRPLESESLWSIRTVVAIEPFTAIAIAPGAEFTWTSTYTYYTLPAGK